MAKNNTNQSANQPKYSFGLLETPLTERITTDTHATSSGYVGGNSDSNTTSGPESKKTPGTSTTKSYFSNLSSGSSSTSTSNFGRTGGFKTPNYGSSSARSKTPASRRTPYTVSSTTPADFNTSVIVAIVEGRGLARGEVGMASIDLKNPELKLSQFSDTQSYVKTVTKLQILSPLEIIMPNTSCDAGTKTKLFQLISDQFQGTNLSTVQRKYFNETRGLQYLKQLCVPEYNTVEMEVSSKYYCLAAAAALIKYVEFIQNIVYAPASLRIVFKGSENTTMIDAATARNLELVQNSKDPKSDHSLYGIMNYTKTIGGARLLRANILQPSSSLETIKMRQDVVSELIEKEEIFYSLQSVVGRFLDTDHLLSLFVQIPKQESIKTAESKITNVIYLKHTLELIEPLREALRDCENPLLKAYYKSLDDPRYTMMMTKISSVIHDDTRFQKGTLNMRTQKCFAVRTDINGLLDVARRTYTEIVDDISQLVTQMSEQYNLPLKTSYSAARGFYIQLYSGHKDQYNADNLPGVFLKVTKFKNTYNFTTTDLIKYNDRIRESLQEIYLMTNIVVTELMSDIRDYIGCLYKLTEAVSMLDMLLAFAHACTLSNYVKPEFTDTLAVKQGRHPILEKISVEPPVPNNTYASEDSNFIVITGPNMIGAFVPAEYASLRVADQIFSRIGSDDDMETNSSTFMLEMREINYIVQNASNKSIIIIDELGRGTSAEEGVGICHSICEYLLRLKAFTFFVTHFMELTNIDSLYPNVENYFFDVQRVFSTEGNCEKILYTHTLSRGKTKEKHYGLQLAEVSTFPRSVIQQAKQTANTIAEEKRNKQEVEGDLKKQRATFKLATRLIQAAKNSRLDEDGLRIYLGNLKNQYEIEIKNIEE